MLNLEVYLVGLVKVVVGKAAARCGVVVVNVNVGSEALVNGGIYFLAALVLYVRAKYNESAVFCKISSVEGNAIVVYLLRNDA